MNTHNKLTTEKSIVDIQQQLKLIDRKAKLSSLWIFMLLNFFVRDIHEFGRSGFLQEMMTGVIDGVQLTEEIFLFSGIMMQIPLGMVFLSRMLPHRFNRWANIIASVFTIGIVINIGANDLDDLLHLAIEVITLAFIIWSAWTWSNSIEVLRSDVTLKS